MIQRHSDSLLLSPRDIQPSQHNLGVAGVFNPAVTTAEEHLYLLARVAERAIESRSGWTALPYQSASGTIEINWLRNEDLCAIDARVVALRNSGDQRLTSVSHLQLFRTPIVSDSDWKFVSSIQPEGPWEEYGIEDPRITKIDNTFWITYVAVSRRGAATALMSTTDFIAFQRHGIIFAVENKDVVLFPCRIKGDFIALHRPTAHSHFSPPQVWLSRSQDLLHWGRHEFVFGGIHPWEGDRVGSGTPPLLCNEGWLMLYHGSSRPQEAGAVGCYCAGAILLDRGRPSQVLRRSQQPIMKPAKSYETQGFVRNIVFPTSMLDRGDDLQVFYGTADTGIATTRLLKQSVLDSLS